MLKPLRCKNQIFEGLTGNDRLMTIPSMFFKNDWADGNMKE